MIFRIGRKKTMLWCSVIKVVGSALSIFAPSYLTFAFGRFLVGYALAGNSLITPVLGEFMQDAAFYRSFFMNSLVTLLAARRPEIDGHFLVARRSSAPSVFSCFFSRHCDEMTIRLCFLYIILSLSIAGR